MSRILILILTVIIIPSMVWVFNKKRIISGELDSIKYFVNGEDIIIEVIDINNKIWKLKCIDEKVIGLLSKKLGRNVSIEYVIVTGTNSLEFVAIDILN